VYKKLSINSGNIIIFKENKEMIIENIIHLDHLNFIVIIFHKIAQIAEYNNKKVALDKAIHN
jgi:hypothetical protein